MKFKLDENLPGELVEEITKRGHDADTVFGEQLVGAEDTAIVNAALSSNRILMTLDKGIASVLRFPKNTHCGIVLFRPDAFGRRAVLAFVCARLPELLSMVLENRVTIVTRGRIRTH